MPVYVLDSNFFIQAHRFHYPIDVAAGFWNKVRQLAEEGRVISIDKVKKELYDKNDALEDCCKNNLPEDFFKDTSVVMAAYAQVTAWAMSRSGFYLPYALNEFLDADEADAFLVAYCLADSANRFVVTQEVSEPNRQNKVKIPDACIALNVSSVNTIEMFRQLGETF
ncbi:DUF4411 domain-containing protein [Sphingobacteriales bacterium UPWRP_1]|nr:DUF4411 domain-containing protein [Sphingobacteriales bacterium UPWRP_1]